MRGPEIKLHHLTALAACFAGAFLLGAEWEKKLELYPVGGDLPRAQPSGEEDEEEEDEEESEEKTYTSREKHTEKGTSQKIYT